MVVSPFSSSIHTAFLGLSRNLVPTDPCEVRVRAKVDTKRPVTFVKMASSDVRLIDDAGFVSFRNVGRVDKSICSDTGLGARRKGDGNLEGGEGSEARNKLHGDA